MVTLLVYAQLSSSKYSAASDFDLLPGATLYKKKSRATKKGTHRHERVLYLAHFVYRLAYILSWWSTYY